MQAFAVGSQLAFPFCLAASGLLVSATGLPLEAFLALFLDPPLIIVVLWIRRSPLPVHLALETTNLLLIGGKFFAQRL